MAVTRKLEIRSDPSELAGLRRKLREFLDGLGLPNPKVELWVLGVDEACTNAIRYAYSGRNDQPLRLSLRRGPRVLSIEIRDYGAPVDPAKLQGRPLDCPAPGGLGLHLIRAAFDEAHYNRCKRGTRLVLKAKLAAH